MADSKPQTEILREPPIKFREMWPYAVACAALGVATACDVNVLFYPHPIRTVLGTSALVVVPILGLAIATALARYGLMPDQRRRIRIALSLLAIICGIGVNVVSFNLKARSIWHIADVPIHLNRAGTTQLRIPPGYDRLVLGLEPVGLPQERWYKMAGKPSTGTRPKREPVLPPILLVVTTRPKVKLKVNTPPNRWYWYSHPDVLQVATLEGLGGREVQVAVSVPEPDDQLTGQYRLVAMLHFGEGYGTYIAGRFMVFLGGGMLCLIGGYVLVTSWAFRPENSNPANTETPPIQG